MVNCCSKNCESNSHKNIPGITFHRFPKDYRKDLWLENLGLQGWKPKPNNVICSKHFEPKFLSPGSLCTRLKPDAIPTLDVPNSTVEPIIASCQPATSSVSSTSSLSTAKYTQTKPDELLEKNKKLKCLINNKNKRIKALSEQRRQLNKKVALFSSVITELQKRIQNESVEILSTISSTTS